MGGNGRCGTSEHTRTPNGSIHVRVPCCVSCLAIGTSQPKQRIVPNQLSQHVYDVGASYPQEPRRQIGIPTRQRKKVATPSRTADPQACRRVCGCSGACHKRRLHEFDLDTTLTDLRRSLEDTYPVRCEEPHVENVAPTSDIVVTLATGIVPISHASRSHHDQRWPGQQLPDGMRALDGREA